MRTFGVPLEAIAAPEALLGAWRTYRSGKRRRPEVACFEMEHERAILRLSDDLLAGLYAHRPYRVLRIVDPKPRLIAVASVRDRLVHTVIHAALAPHFNRSFIDDSYACLPGRGSHRAVLRFLDLQRRFAYVLHLDIRRYFPSVDHEILRGLVVARLRDRRIDRVVDAILASGRVLYGRAGVRAFFEMAEDGDGRHRGLPIGNLTSQWWGNLYLDGLDHFVKRELRVNGYLRYMDDLVLFAADAAALRGWRAEIAGWLQVERRLELNPRKGHVRSTALPQAYLGHRITRAGYDLGPKAVRRFRAGLPELLASGDGERIRRTLAAWKGAMRF